MQRKHTLLLWCLTICSIVSFVATAGGQPYPRPEGPPAPPRDYVIFNNSNVAGVLNGPSRRTRFTVSEPYFISFIQTYHYYNDGHLPGFISLRSRDGTQYGPWPATGRRGQGDVPNAYWNCYPNITIPAGTYVIEDSDPETWSHNAASGFRGISQVRGRPIY